MEGRRQHLSNLKGVLQLSLEAGSAAVSTPVEPMPEDRAQWLRGALAEVSRWQTDEVEQMKRCLIVLHKDDVNVKETEEGEREERDDEDEREAALDLLSDLCENLDNARDLMTLGGLELCVARCLRHARSGVRWRAAQLLASSAQNMPEVQRHLLNDVGALPVLLQMADTDPRPVVRVKALYAVSCLVGGEQRAGLEAFLSHGGFSTLARGMQSDDEKLRTKWAFLLLKVLTAHPEHKDTVLSMGVVQQLVSVLRSPHSAVHEHVLGALCCLVEECPQGVQVCRRPSLSLEELLRLRAKDLQGREECEEELDFCQRLRSVCFGRRRMGLVDHDTMHL